MSRRILEEALKTSPISLKKSACSSCEKKFLCHRLSDVLEDIAEVQIHEHDIEFKIRIQSLHNELNRLGFVFPEGLESCEISQKMTHKEATQLLLEGQELLIEMKSRDTPEDQKDQKTI